jgi:hypothetical protein
MIFKHQNNLTFKYHLIIKFMQIQKSLKIVLAYDMPNYPEKNKL